MKTRNSFNFQLYVSKYIKLLPKNDGCILKRKLEVFYLFFNDCYAPKCLPSQSQKDAICFIIKYGEKKTINKHAN